MLHSIRVLAGLAFVFAATAALAEVDATPVVGSLARFDQYDDEVDRWLEQMTLADKIGQMTQADLDFVPDKALIGELGLGSILSGGSSDPEDGNSVEAWGATYDACQKAALRSRLGIPILYGIDAVHGHNNVTGAVIFPHNIGLGCANDEDLVEQISRLTALEVRATGIQWTFAPCVTVPRDDRWGRTYEGYSEDPERVARLGAASVRGLQTKNLSDPYAVLACAKHFIGDGGTSGEVRQSWFHESPQLVWDQGDTRCDLATLRRVHLAPYLPCLEAGVGTIMPSYSSWNGVKCTVNSELLTDLLKEELGFQGFLISDYKAIDQCHDDYKTAIGMAINAGIDMAMTPEKYREYIQFLTELVEEGTVPMSRIDDAVRRILRVKASMGLLDSERDQLSSEEARAGFGSDERRLVAREAVQKSLVLLKNDGVLPLAGDQGTIHVAGTAADDIGIQCGGWTIDWQGKAGNITSGGTTLLAGLRWQVAGARVTYTADGKGAELADVAIVVVGEAPYAEGHGDDPELALSDSDQALIQSLGESEAQVVLVIVSGRPLILDEKTLDSADAIVAAWLPGSEGGGVADVLFGSAQPTGTLSFSWPRSADQHPINLGDREYAPLFPVGHGLTYRSKQLTQRKPSPTAGR